MKENKKAPLKGKAKVDPPKQSTEKTQQSKNEVNVIISEIQRTSMVPLTNKTGEDPNAIDIKDEQNVIHRIIDTKDEEKVIGTKDEEKILLEKEFKDHKCLYFTCFFVIGIINFSGFNYIGTASQDLAQLFNYSDQMPIFTVCLLLSAVLIQMANSRWFLQVNHKLKICLVASGMTSGY